MTIYATTSGEPSPLTGAVLTVLAVDLPFLCVLLPGHGCHIGLDTRQVELKRLSDAYVTAMTTVPLTAGTTLQARIDGATAGGPA